MLKIESTSIIRPRFLVLLREHGVMKTRWKLTFNLFFLQGQWQLIYCFCSELKHILAHQFIYSFDTLVWKWKQAVVKQRYCERFFSSPPFCSLPLFLLSAVILCMSTSSILIKIYCLWTEDCNQISSPNSDLISIDPHPADDVTSSCCGQANDLKPKWFVPQQLCICLPFLFSCTQTHTV